MAVDMTTHAVEAVSDNGAPIRIPYWQVDSRVPGPCVLLVAAQHGNEVHGAEVLRRIVRDCPDSMAAGRILAFPMANPPALHARRPHIGMRPEQPYSAPESRAVNMNLLWPGAADGNLPARLVQAIHSVAAAEATHAFDLHCWAGNRAPAVLLREIEGLRSLVMAMGPRFADVRPPAPSTLGGYFCERGLVGLSVELSGQYMIEEGQAWLGVRWVTNFLRAIGCFAGDPEPVYQRVLFSDASRSHRQGAPATGLFVESPGIQLCEWLEKGTELGHILREDDLATVPVIAEVSGFVRMFGAWRDDCDVALPGRHPYVREGDELVLLVEPAEA